MPILRAKRTRSQHAAFADIQHAAEALEVRASEVELLTTYLDKFARLLRIPKFSKNANGVDVLVDIAKVLVDTSTELLADRTKSRLAANAPDLFEKLSTQQNQISHEGVTLASWIKIDYRTIQSAHVSPHKSALEGPSVLDFLG